MPTFSDVICRVCNAVCVYRHLILQPYKQSWYFMKLVNKNLVRLSASISLVAGTVLAVSNSAYAAGFTTNFTQINGAEGDIFLNSVTQKNKNGQDVTIKDFSFVNQAEILQNTEITRKANRIETANPEEVAALKQQNPGQKVENNNTGAASTDRGDRASAPMTVSGMNNPTGTEVAAFLGNNNLNNIIDTEENGHFSMNLFFDSLIRDDGTGLDNFFIWERGFNTRTSQGNSDLDIQAIDKDGNEIGNLVKLLRKDQTYAGYSIDTTEIGAAQRVGSWGVSLAQLGLTGGLVNGVRLTTRGSSYNGPDFKIVARRSELRSRAVPEPGTLLALGIVGGLAFFSRRQQKNLVSEKIQ